MNTCMTPQDRDLMEKMMLNALASLDGKFDLIDYKLTALIEQTTKTNGRVTKLEEKELLHVVNCPQNARIAKLEDTQKGTAVINKWIVRGITISGTIVAIVWGIVQIIKSVGAI